MTFTLKPARSASDLALAARLFREYAAELGEDLCFQGFAEELASLPGRYAPPKGEILLARLDDALPVGCIAMCPLDAPGEDRKICEMKRMYVQAAGRGHGIGRAMVAEVLGLARNAGYEAMRLDTLSRLKAALHLYQEAGFLEITAYYENPLPGVIYFEKQL
ncbi:MAG: GNAT family N-acetyltransferase [Aquisalinus sp.]|nr:GNAT family N-acetyltransferase [Aquisalinus sp.]